MKKKCSKCGLEKTTDEFYKDKAFKDGHRSSCAECDIRKSTRWNIRNPVKHASHERKYRTNNPESVKGNKALYVKNNPENVKDSFLKCKYGITLVQYKNMVKTQDGRCAICDIHISCLNEALCVDHCHATGKVRKLLCRPCNSALGLIKENISTAKRIIEYLEEYNELKNV